MAAKSAETAPNVARSEGHDRPEDHPVSIDEGMIVDYITGELVPDTSKEQVRQLTARALFHEYGIAVDDMARDFLIHTQTDKGIRRRRADIAIFEAGASHTVDHLSRIVVCKPEPKATRGVTKLRTYEQANKDLLELKELMLAVPNCDYGLWSNGLELFFLHKEETRFATEFHPKADWPLADGTVGSRTVASHARLRRAEPNRLKLAYRRCHNYIHGNEGMPKDAAFWQFLYLLFAKMHDERSYRTRGGTPRFYAGMDEPFTEKGRKQIKARIDQLFAEVKFNYPTMFGPRDELTLSERALAFLVAELAPYDLSGTDVDAKGLAYQELVGANLRGDRGQYFTPRGAVALMVDILDPKEDERVLDPACGTGGFLRETLKHILDSWRAEEGTLGEPDTEQQQARHQERLARYAKSNLFGADFDPFLVRATIMNNMTIAQVDGHVFHMDSLAFPNSHLDGNAPAKTLIPLGSIDVLMTNPPFGVDIPITDRDVLRPYEHGVAQSWMRDRETGDVVARPNPVTSMSPEQLFVQRAIEWVRPGGRLGIVLPNGMLSNPGPTDEAIRRYILDQCWILASIELPVETFIVDAGVNILTSLLFLKRKTAEERDDAAINPAINDYPIFMAVAEKVGFDRRGNLVYKRQPDGEIVTETREERERIRINGDSQVRILRRTQPVVDNDLPEIAKRYREFREKYPLPGIVARPGERP